MIVTTNCYLNKRFGAPDTKSACPGYLDPETKVAVTETVVGQMIEGNYYWHKGTDGYYYWNGGFQQSEILETIPIKEEDLHWHIYKFGIDKIWQKTQGEGINVAILDSGIQRNHPDLKDARIILTRNFLYSGIDENMMNDVEDRSGHGTHCAGILCAQKKGACGVAPGINLMVGKITESDFNLDPNALISGIQWAYDNQADIISVSQNISEMSENAQALLEALDGVSKYKGILIGALSNAGDYGYDVNDFPYSHNCCIGIGAIDKNFKMDPSTARTSFLKLLGPGRNIYSTWIGGMYRPESGCSMAAPYIAGIMALIISYIRKRPRKLTKKQILEIITTNTSFHTGYLNKPEGIYPIVDPIRIFNFLK